MRGYSSLAAMGRLFEVDPRPVTLPGPAQAGDLVKELPFSLGLARAMTPR
ncbi:hypothetical protein FA95DRAFT_1554172 [Auriscalpium vulgare]|uniref:Uncharacterized protein n=1 Tax=Auriscalpium vulgare TaxID=40419 RepID=A0ACB8S5B0_9AGAM|nr:hypothetical protein FA95DRAFT_1554172 [Auriscalpium vulgare]